MNAKIHIWPCCTNKTHTMKREFAYRILPTENKRISPGLYFCFALGVETIIAFYYRRYINTFLLFNIWYDNAESCVNIKWNNKMLLHQVNYHSEINLAPAVLFKVRFVSKVSRHSSILLLESRYLITKVESQIENYYSGMLCSLAW